jgi:hypothetical protein
MRYGLRICTLILCGALSYAPVVLAQSDKPGVDPRVDTILRSMGDYLKTAREFSFKTTVNYDQVLESGQKILYARRAEISMRRPNRLHARMSGDLETERVWIDVNAFTLLDLRENAYFRLNVPSNMDEALDFLARDYGISSPVADVLYSDPYAILIEFVKTGTYVGQSVVRGVPTHHLAFTQNNIDWQLWVEDGPHPVPRKFIITYKKVASTPQFTAWLSDWDFDPRLSDSLFQFIAPQGAEERELKPLDR